MKKQALFIYLIASLLSLGLQANEGESFDWSAWEKGSEIVFTQNDNYDIQDSAGHAFFNRKPKTIENRKVPAGTRATLHGIGCAGYGTKPFTVLANTLGGLKCVAVIKLKEGEFINIEVNNVYGFPFSKKSSKERFISNYLQPKFYTNKKEKASTSSIGVNNSARDKIKEMNIRLKLTNRELLKNTVNTK